MVGSEAFADRLLKGEKIVWTGRPAQGLLLTGRDVFLIPFSLLWTGLAGFIGLTSLSQPNAPAFARLVPILFMLLGLYIVVGHFLVDAWLRGKIDYAITSSRILISRSGPFPKFTALKLDRMPDASLSERAAGRGTIRFGPQVSVWGRGNASAFWTPSLDPTPQFIAIEDARKVFDQIQQRTAALQV